ncbi:hypothetical protein LWI28_004879 [Acer negundo]|uniref:Uncharacterized protein n=1 Tax=Acer negundo TaxID=4023 RepID=A0AAD5NXE6_ACENE|nr:hypothetical protein LWI28_004879 [Acer negundo]KAK4853510.1 hypothetical protein QYF36_010308 [Acer negundo]
MAEESETATSSSSYPQPSSTSPPDANLKQSQVPAFSGFTGFGNGDVAMLPVMYPAAFLGSTPWDNQQQTNNRGAGIYAVPVHPYTGIPSNTLIPLTYNIPTSRPSTEGGAASPEHGQAGQQQPAHQRQDGSRLRLIFLVFFASLIYLYQTGALTPLLRWLQQSMQRAAAPPHQPRPAVRADNAPAAAGQGNENAALAEGQAGAENENEAQNEGNRAEENQNGVEPGVNGGNQWWGIVKEIQMIVFGFITSLLPGFHNID